MNYGYPSRQMGALSSDRRIENVFHAFDHAIPVARYGRRLWSLTFKRDIAAKMKSGELTAAEVKKACQITDHTISRWRRQTGERVFSSAGSDKTAKAAFAERRVTESKSKREPSPAPLLFKRSGCELRLPIDYPVDRLIQLIQAFEIAP